MTTTNVNAVQNQIDFYQIEEVCASLIFPDVYQPGQVKLKRRANRHPDCLPSNPDYVPDQKTLRRVLAWWFAPRLKSLGLFGETGTGKTDMLLYVADRLNEPVYLVKVHPALMPEDIEGCKDLATSPAGIVSKNSLGLAAKAYRNGGLLILDEVDKVNAPLGCALHGLVEGKPWPIEQFNVVINQHPMCRVAGTANTMGEGGHERYHTSNRMDQALRSRFGWLRCDFPDVAREMAILGRKFGKMLPTPMLRDMVKLANAMRDALLGPNRDGKIDNPINAVFSTRNLVQWANYAVAYGPDALWSESLSFALDGSVDPECEAVVKDIVQRTLGQKIEMSVADVLKSYNTPKP
jgi:cobaltochelatase CobS